MSSLRPLKKRFVESDFPFVGWDKDEGFYVIKSWDEKYGFYPAIISYHGCGCCGGDKPKPTKWMPLPKVK